MQDEQDDHKETLFNSPIPLLIRLRNFIFGKEKPDSYTKVTFYLNFIPALLFFFWNIASFFAVYLRQLIQDQKGVPVDLIIRSRGEMLGFDGEEFVSRVQTFYSVSAICWFVVLFGTILIWRKRERFVYFIFGGTLFYLGMTIFYMNYSFFKEDITFFDKIIYLAVLANSLLYFLLLRKEKRGESLSFFGEDEQDSSAF